MIVDTCPLCCSVRLNLKKKGDSKENTLTVHTNPKPIAKRNPIKSKIKIQGEIKQQKESLYGSLHIKESKKRERERGR